VDPGSLASNGIRVLNPTTGDIRVKQDVRFIMSLNFEEKKKSANEIWHKSSPTSSLAKLPKFSTSSTTPVLSPPIETVPTNSPINNLTIEAIYKPVYKEI